MAGEWRATEFKVKCCECGEIFKRWADGDLPACPKCGSFAVTYEGVKIVRGSKKKGGEKDAKGND